MKTKAKKTETKKQYVYVVTTTCDTEESNYNTGTIVEKVFNDIKLAKKHIKYLEDQYADELDDCVETLIEITEVELV